MTDVRELPLATLAALLAATLAGVPAGAADPAEAPLVLPFAVDGAPAAWARAAVPGRLSPGERLRRLSRALLEPGGRPIAEQPGSTPTAAEAFARRRANCVGYASLFVGLARELGVPAYFVLVDGLGPPPGAAIDDGIAVAEGHLAAAWGRDGELRVYDFAGESDGASLAARAITDLAAIAVFYSNRGVEALLAGDGDDAVAALRLSTELEPSLPSTWVNLGVALRHAGDLEEARRAYERALELDPAAGAAYRNLAVLLALRGRSNEAADLLATARELSALDSLGTLDLARRALLLGDLQEARGLYRKALDLSRVHSRR